MSFWESKEIAKTRKMHKCEYCGVIIPIGVSCWKEVGADGFDFNSYYLCGRCRVYIIKYIDSSSEPELNSLLDDIDGTSMYDNCPKCGGYYADFTWVDDKRQSLNMLCNKCGHTWQMDLSEEAIAGWVE